MSKHYHHLTRDQRCQIAVLIKRGESQASIARSLGKDPSTICREIKRNSIQRKGCAHSEYIPQEAQRKSLRKRRKASQRPNKLISETKQAIIDKLQLQWSPEQIAGWLKRHQYPVTVSHETIYKMIWRDKRKGGNLYKHLRRYRKKYHKRGSPKAGRSCIPNRVDIEERPEIVELKERLGDWEIDTIVGKGHQGAVVTMVDRASRLTKLYHVPRKTASNVAEGLISKLSPLKDFTLTVTADNGGEFAKHESVSAILETSFYFSKPYHSWERALNEHTNGLLRQYLPKDMALKDLAQDRIDEIENLLNNRPRKVLNYETPLEVFERLSQGSMKIALQN